MRLTFLTALCPVLLYRSVLAVHTAGKARAFRERFKKNDWTGIWTDTIYEYTHFHSNAHEVLGIAAGKVTLRLGGDNGSLLRLKAGDMLVLPAGVGHRRVSVNEVKAIGAYPRGQSHYDVKRKGRTVPHRWHCPPPIRFMVRMGHSLRHG